MKKGEGGGGGVGGSKLGRWLGAPMRALSRACDSYVRKMSACAGGMPTHAGAMGRGGFAPASMQAATFSSRSRRTSGGSEEDVNELVRAMSQRQQAAAGRGVGAGAGSVPVRSRSVAAAPVGRIDEDEPCDFGGADAAVRVGRPPRPAVRRSHTVAVGGGGFVAMRGAGGFAAATKKVPGVGGVVHG